MLYFCKMGLVKWCALLVCYETEMPMMSCRQPSKQPRHDRLGVFFYPAYHIGEKINIKACLPHTISWLQFWCVPNKCSSPCEYVMWGFHVCVCVCWGGSVAESVVVVGCLTLSVRSVSSVVLIIQSMPTLSPQVCGLLWSRLCFTEIKTCFKFLLC